VLAICLEEGVNLVQDLLCALFLGLALAQAAGATATIMLIKMIASQVQPQSAGICTPRTTMMDIIIAGQKQYHFCNLILEPKGFVIPSGEL
jgi:hypothetical protein